MALNFPDNPTVGDTYTSGLYTWTWDGTVWRGKSVEQNERYSDNFLMMGAWVAYNKEFYEANKELILGYQKKYRENNLEKERARKKKYKLNNPDKFAGYERKRRALKRDLAFSAYTTNDVIEIYGSLCHICGKQIDLAANRRSGLEGWEQGLQVDHLVSLHHGGADTIENVRPAHGQCNARKNRYNMKQEVK